MRSYFMLISLLLAYSVGEYRLLDYGKVPKSNLVKKLEAGDRDIYQEYISFRKYRGKVISSIERRKKGVSTSVYSINKSVLKVFLISNVRRSFYIIIHHQITNYKYGNS